MEKVTIRYESDQGMHKKCQIELEGNSVELEVGAAAILHQVSEAVAESTGDDLYDVALHIFGSVIRKIIKDKEKKSE